MKHPLSIPGGTYLSTIKAKLYESVKKSSRIGQDEETLILYLFLRFFLPLVPKFCSWKEHWGLGSASTHI